MAGIIATRDAGSGAIRVLAYHYPLELREAPPLSGSPADAEKILALGQPKDFRIEIRDLAPGATIHVETLDATHGFCLPPWKEMGAPEPPSREQTKLLQEAAWNVRREVLTTDASGTFRLQRVLDPWSIVLLREVRMS